MAGWSQLKSCPSLNVVEIARKLQSFGFCSDLDPSAAAAAARSKEELSLLFNAILSRFLKENSLKREIRPLPPMLCDGRSVDPFELYRVVGKMGGYDSVSRRRSWGSVAEEAGFDPTLAPSLKLIYGKYLLSLDRWLRCRVLDAEVSNRFRENPNPMQRGHFLTPVRANANVRLSNRQVSSLINCKPKLEDGGTSNGDDVAVLNWDLVGMVDWVKGVAMNPNDPSIASSENFSHVLLARRAMYLKRIRNNADGSLPQEKQNPFSSIDANRAKKIKCNQGFKFSNMHPESLKTPTSPESDKDKELMADEDWIQIPLGPSFQVKLPDWDRMRCETSSKWLGTRIWPPMDQITEPHSGHDPIGRGRSQSCACISPKSVECVRFHVAEKRVRLKLEVGSAFFKWRFDRMGEEAALSWTEEEEDKFKEIVSLTSPTPPRGFWDRLCTNFPTRGSRDLVNYYFNVFLLARRSYQNRATPKKIDSDDDEETQFGFLSSRFGHDAVSLCDPKPIFCAHNVQCEDLDEYMNED